VPIDPAGFGAGGTHTAISQVLMAHDADSAATVNDKCVVRLQAIWLVSSLSSLWNVRQD